MKTAVAGQMSELLPDVAVEQNTTLLASEPHSALLAAPIKLRLDNHFYRVLSLGNKLESQACFRQPQPMGNHLPNMYFASFHVDILYVEIAQF